jgi:NAD-dependent DNA ligase
MIAKELQKYMPTHCPSCGKPLTFDGIHLYCSNDVCEGRVACKLSYACGMLDLKGIAGQTIKPFAKDFKNMYELFVWVYTYGMTKDIEKYGINYNSRSHEIFTKAFFNIKSLKYSQIILMMGIDGVGRKLSEQAAIEYCGLTPNYASIEKALVKKLQEPEIVSYIKEAVKTLESLGVKIDKPSDKVNNNNMKSTIYVCMTGSPKAFGYKTKEEFISQFDNVSEVSVTDARCNFLITDSLTSVSGKMKNAAKKGVKIVTYGTFKAE